MLSDEIAEYYRRGGERDRLAEGQGRLEFLRTWDVLTRVLPDPPAEILDVGGATGVYAAPLADAGYRVHVVDPVPEHVAAAAARSGVTAALGDARSLSEADASVDAVLLLGPLYHLLEREQRVLAWREARRVVRPGGVVAAALISRYASLFDGFVHGFFDDPGFRPLVEHVLAGGVHLGGVRRGADPERTWFTSAYFHHPAEVAAEVTEAGLVVERIVAVEGPVWQVGPGLGGILADPERTALLLEMLRRVESEPSLLGASSHLIAVARA
ncbi:class I SAM-dependent methyltransferase [Micromonospora sp. NPDC050417]|uniref:class I SAM-dependent methyltransferase n=1 Tax=Micromonospora sp. NPDC050417 TaxID=3364280 RepID=UPI00379E4F97